LSVIFTQGRVIQELGREGILPYSSFFASSKPFNTPSAGCFILWFVSSIYILAPPPGDTYLFMLNRKQICSSGEVANSKQCSAVVSYRPSQRVPIRRPAPPAHSKGTTPRLESAVPCIQTGRVVLFPVERAAGDCASCSACGRLQSV